MKYKEINSEVLFSSDEIVKVNQADIEKLKAIACKNIRKRSRLCTHENNQSALHEMLIVHLEGIYVRPHKHLQKDEAFHIIEGDLDVIIFDNSGQLLELINMGDYASGKVFYYRLPESTFHTVIIRTGIAVFHEVTLGPFSPQNTVFAEWAPEEADPKAVNDYREKLDREIRNFVKNDR